MGSSRPYLPVELGRSGEGAGLVIVERDVRIAGHELELDARDVGPGVERPARELLTLRGERGDVGRQRAAGRDVEGAAAIEAPVLLGRPLPAPVGELVGDLVVGGGVGIGRGRIRVGFAGRRRPRPLRREREGRRAVHQRRRHDHHRSRRRDARPPVDRRRGPGRGRQRRVPRDDRRRDARRARRPEVNGWIV